MKDEHADLRRAPDDTGFSMGVIGPMARSVINLAMLFSVQGGVDPRVPLSAPAAPRNPQRWLLTNWELLPARTKLSPLA
jgi:Asp-tRNA(Asn)/Glu-tRNA(Gln) amidotransferase A subunit family amidase